MLRIVQMSKRGKKTRGTHGAGGSGRSQRRLISEWPLRVSYSANKNQASGMPTGRYAARESATQGGQGFGGCIQCYRAGPVGIAAKLDKWQRAGDETTLQDHCISRVWRPLGDLRSVYSRAAAPDGTRPGSPTRMGRRLSITTPEFPCSHRSSGRVDKRREFDFACQRNTFVGATRAAEEIATEALGYRSAAHADESAPPRSGSDRYTPLDRILQIEQRLHLFQFCGHRLTEKTGHCPNRSENSRRNTSPARLMHLQRMGLAQFVGG